MSKLSKTQSLQRQAAVRQLRSFGISVADDISYKDAMLALNETKCDVKASDISFVLDYNIPEIGEVFKMNCEQVKNLIEQLVLIESIADKVMIDYYHIVEFGMLSAAKLNHMRAVLKTILTQRRKSKNLYPKVVSFQKILEGVVKQDDDPDVYTYRTGLLSFINLNEKEPKED